MPLNAVRAFEAAARHGNLSGAADELCVTSTAISHQIRGLEEFLQVKLFDRHGGRLELTSGAQLVRSRLTDALDRIEFALDELRPADDRERLIIAASPSLTSLWLLPRLQRFVASAPKVDVALAELSPDGSLENADIAICHRDTALDRRIEPLMHEEIVPVCAPALLKKVAGDGRRALMQLPLIHDDKTTPLTRGLYPTWDTYFNAFGLPPQRTGTGLRFSFSSHSVEAALDGHGVLLGRTRLIEPALVSGRLVKVADPYPALFPYYLVSPLQRISRAGSMFCDWLRNEVATDTIDPAA